MWPDRVTVCGVEWTADTIRPLVAAWDRKMVSGVDARGPAAEIRVRESVLRPPATAEAIGAAEEGLGRRLPPSYRAFLEISDGAHASMIGPEVRAMERHGFLPVAEIGPARELDAEHLELWTGDIVGMTDPAHAHGPIADGPIEVRHSLPALDGVLVSRPVGTFRAILVPRPDTTEWELWDFGASEILAHRSFADLLEWQLGLP